ncbi:MAG: hypothetical protein GX941_00550 [Candidatus Methanofastidiosa archaeon]|nr:hypothetical protein [Candidatus Methanofastidiosa archaeon]
MKKTLNIPKTLKVNGHTYKVIVRKDREIQDGSYNQASSLAPNLTIWIDGRQSLSRQESCLIHEIIEILNYDFEIGLSHEKITQLETGIYQVLKDNKLLNSKKIS